MNSGQFKKGQHWRPRRPWYDRDWLVAEYAVHSTGEIAAAHGVTDAAILFWLNKHLIPARDISAARALKHWGAVGAKNPMYGLARGPKPELAGRPHACSSGALCQRGMARGRAGGQAAGSGLSALWGDGTARDSSHHLVCSSATPGDGTRQPYSLVRAVPSADARQGTAVAAAVVCALGEQQ